MRQSSCSLLHLRNPPHVLLVHYSLDEHVVLFQKLRMKGLLHVFGGGTKKRLTLCISSVDNCCCCCGGCADMREM